MPGAVCCRPVIDQCLEPQCDDDTELKAASRLGLTTGHRRGLRSDMGPYRSLSMRFMNRYHLHVKVGGRL